MRGVTALVWAILVGGIVLGMMALFATKLFYGPDGPDEGLPIFAGARELDAKTRSHLEDLGIRFGSSESSKEPTLNLENPTDADFAFLDKILETNDTKGKISAAKVLRDIGDARSVEPLVKASTGVDLQANVFYAQCALTILADKPPEVVRATLIPALVRHRKDLDRDLVDGFRHKLKDAGALDADFLRQAAVSDRDPDVRLFALDELSAAKHPPLGIFAAAMGDPDAGVRKYADAQMSVFHR